MRRYSIVAFVSGAAVMIAEIAAARAIAPHFGTSIIVWTNVIGIILVALSLGYWIGGVLAERRPDTRTLGTIIAAAGALLIIPAFATSVIAESFIGALLRGESGFLVLALGSFVSVVVLFALPIALLGMVSPFLVKLASAGRSDTGAVAGRLYAISTVGSLIGTFLPTLVLLPLLGTRRTILAAAAVLFVLGCVLAARRRIAMIGGIALLSLMVIPAVPPPWFLGTVLAATESRYQYLRIVEYPHGGRTERALLFNEGLGIQSVDVDSDALPDGYFATVAALPALLFDDERGVTRSGGPPPRGDRIEHGGGAQRQDPERIRVLILGNAGGTIGSMMQRMHPDRAFDITGVELDPAVTALTAAHFTPPPTSYPIVHADSRAFVRESRERYDIIVVDAYTNQLTIPSHLASVEFFRLLWSRLAPGGFVVANVNAPRRDSRLLRTFTETFANAFPSVWVGSPGSWNHLILASNAEVFPFRFEMADVPFAHIPAGVGAPGDEVFTDDWAPLELMTDIEIFDALRQRVR